MRHDLLFSSEVIGILFALEVQHCIEVAGSAMMTSIPIPNDEPTDIQTYIDDLMEWYGMPVQTSHEIIAECAKKYAAQIVNLALYAAKKYQEHEAKKLLHVFIRFSAYFEGKVNGDGNVFGPEDKQQLLAYAEEMFSEYHEPTLVRASTTTSGRNMRGVVKSLQLLFGGITDDDDDSSSSHETNAAPGHGHRTLNQHAIVSAKDLSNKISLSTEYVAPINGINGLRGIRQEQPKPKSEKKNWGWGGG